MRLKIGTRMKCYWTHSRKLAIKESKVRKRLTIKFCAFFHRQKMNAATSNANVNYNSKHVDDRNTTFFQRDLLLDKETEKLKQIELYRKNKLVSPPSVTISTRSFFDEAKMSSLTSEFDKEGASSLIDERGLSSTSNNRNPPIKLNSTPTVSNVKNLYHYSNLLNNLQEYKSEPSLNRDQCFDEDHVEDNNFHNQELFLLNSRIQALQEIIQIQSLEIEKQSNGKSVDQYKQNIQVLLLTKWREKVFELLVQSKSCEMTVENERKHYITMERTLTDQINALKYELSLSNQREKDLSANIKLIEAKNRYLDVTVKKMNHRERVHSQDSTNFQDASRSVQTQLSSFSNSFFDSMLKELGKQRQKLDSYMSRLSFASDRVEVISRLMIQRKGHKTTSTPEIPQKGHHGNALIEENSNEELIRMLQVEVARLVQDRDYLMNNNQVNDQRIREEMTQVTRRIEGERDQAYQLIEKLKQELFLSEEKLNTTTSECKLLNESLLKAQLTLTEELDGIRMMRQQFLQLQRQNQLEKDEAIRRVVIGSDKSNTILRDELSILRTELSKKTAQLSQMERMLIKERENVERTLEERNKRLIEKDEEIKSLREEKTSLLSALKNKSTSEEAKSPEKQPKQGPERDIMIQALDNLATLTHHYMNSNSSGDYLDI